MIDLNKIEAAAKAATGKQYPELAVVEHWDAANPATVLEMVSMIRERDAVLRQALECFGEVAAWESEGDPAHPASKAIAAIKGALCQQLPHPNSPHWLAHHTTKA